MSKDSPSNIQYIDGKRIWGTEGNMPKKEYANILVRQGSSVIELPKEAIEGLYNPSLFSTKVFHDDENQTLYIQAFNSDGAAAYAVAWIIEKGIYKKRVVEIPF